MKDYHISNIIFYNKIREYAYILSYDKYVTC